MFLGFTKCDKSNVAKKAEVVKKAISGFSFSENMQMRAIMQEVETIEKQIAQIAKEGNHQKKCINCQGACCEIETQEFLIHKVDLAIMLFEISQAEEEKIMRLIEDQSEKCPYCCFLDPQIGCLIQEARRPIVCITHFCDSKLEKKINKLADQLIDIAEKIREILFASLSRQEIFSKELTPAKYPF